MPIIKRVNKIQNLDQLIVDIEDSSQNSPDFFNIFGLPVEFPSGKTAILINGSNNLSVNSEVRVEILDSDRNVIYTQPVNFLEGVSRLISVFVYPDDSFGEAILTIVGQFSKNLNLKQIISNDIQIPGSTGKRLIRWQRKILINPGLENTSKIRFFKDPIVTVTETLRPYLKRTFGGNTGSHELLTGTISGKVADSEYVLTSNGFDFTGQMVGATVFVSSPTITNNTGSTPVVITPYTSSITKVINANVAIAKDPYQIQTDAEKDLQTIEQKVFQFPPPNTFNFITSPYTMSILTEPTFSTTQNIRSFARVNVAKMTPFSGDVNLVKLYMKSEGTIGDFELVADQVLESTEILVDSSSLKFNVPTGYFLTQSTIESFWSASVNDTTVPTASLVYTSSKIIDSMLITGSDARLLEGQFYKIDNILPVDFDENAEYTFEAEFHAVKKQAQELLSPIRTFEKNDTLTDVNLAKIKVYVSGSAFVPNAVRNRIVGEDPAFGKLIQEIELSSNSIPEEQTIGKVSKNFIADRDGNGRIIFIVEAGDWHIHDVSIKFSQETGFSPDLTTFHIPISDWERNDPIKFKAEFYDVNNNKSTVFATSSEVTFEGGNLYIGGDDNLITGSIFIGNVTSSGIEMAGVNSAFLRSVGYAGYVSASDHNTAPGFMMWSGAVTLGATTDEYGGVGLELHGGSGSAINPDTGIGETHGLRYRTDTGNLEITGAIQATFISASAGEIGGWVIKNNALLSPGGMVLSGSSGIIRTAESGQRIIIDGSSNELSFVSGNFTTTLELKEVDGRGAMSLNPGGFISFTQDATNNSRLLAQGSVSPGTNGPEFEWILCTVSYDANRTGNRWANIRSNVNTNGNTDSNPVVAIEGRSNDASPAFGQDIYAIYGKIDGVNGISGVEPQFAGYFEGGNVFIEKRVGIGTESPDGPSAGSSIHIYSDEITGTPLLTLEQDGATGQAAIAFQRTGLQTWTIGQESLDNSFKIVPGTDILSDSGLTIETGGNVGIEISDPDSMLEVSGTTNIGSVTTDVHQSTGSLRVSGSAFITGSLSIGETGVTLPLILHNALAGPTSVGMSFSMNDHGEVAKIIGKTLTSTTGRLEFYTEATGSITEHIRIDSDGGLFAFNLLAAADATNLSINASDEIIRDSSARRYKRDITDIEIDTSKLYNLRPVSFEHINVTGSRTFGLIAEEVIEEIPQLVYLNKEGQCESVNYSYLSVILLTELKKLKAENDGLKVENDGFEERLKKIEAHLNI